MLKNNKKQLLLSSAVTLVPILVGLLLWNRLPAHMTTHWGADGVADGWGSKAFTVFGMPLILLAVQWLCLWITSLDKKNKGQSNKVFGMVMWIIPILSLYTSGITYAVALGKDFHNDTLSLAFLGLVFVIVGNYLPKTKQNFTIGIKIKWTLASEENWNATHRLAGKLWVLGGLGMMACIFLPVGSLPWVLVAWIIVMTTIPVLYSYRYYRKQAKAGEVPEKAVIPLPGWSRGARVAMMIFMAVLLVGIAVVMFTGSIQVEYGEDSFTIRASYWDDLTVEYAAIDQVEYREDFSPGVRMSGFGSPRLGLGSFRNEELGNYTLYDHAGCDAVVVMKIQGKTLVFGGKTQEQTVELYQQIMENR